jgi:preprotein translocase subunit YajC
LSVVYEVAAEGFAFKLPLAQKSPMPILAIFLAQAPPAAPAPGPAGGIGFFVPFIFIFVIMYFVLFRPQKKRQQDQQRLISSLKTGDRVVTNAGIHGLIANVKETTVILKVADNVKIEMEKSAVTSVLKES